MEKAPTRSAASSTASPAKVSPPTFSTARPLLLGHRGARPVSRVAAGSSRKAIPPENTIASFEHALTHGCDGFEFDVRVTQDHRLVLCHDERIGRRKVSASSFEGLCSVGKLQLACLEDVLQAFGDRAYLDIEVKVAGAEEAIAKALKECTPRCGYILSSFLPKALLRFHQLDPSLPLGYLCERSDGLLLWRELPIQVFLPQYKLITAELVGDVHDRGLRIFTWTVNRERDMLRLSALGVDGLISDDPGLLTQTFSPVESSGQEPKAKG
jgi:glycerophosphoryl diester phosphodiesterase